MLLNNRYRVLQTLGSGGFGETFLAEDTQMPSLRRCVIKQLKPIASNPQIYQLVQERFGREAVVLEELGGSSDRIPSLYAYFQLNEQFYLVQEYIEGDTLTAKLHNLGLFTESTVRDILISLLLVLEYVHNKQIIHRDIKPDNIILRRCDGRPILIDFGAVREIMGTVINSQGSAASSIIIGTPGYMSSEQAAGRAVYSSDLYSLGMTAIYLLTGKKPQELEVNPISGELIWRHQYASNISPIMIGVIDKVIRYHPKERFATAREMMEALQSEVITIDPTVPYIREVADTQPPSFVDSFSPTPNDVVIKDSFSSSVKKPKDRGKKETLAGSLITGSLIGASVIIGFALNRTPQSVFDSSNSTSIQEPEIQSQTSEISKSSLDDYSWLSQRLVKNPDLDNKNGFELDIMRNSIFARHGYRFRTLGLQKYFDDQPWYTPKYLPQDFPENLLSHIEVQNVEFIARYQDRYNKRYFPK